MKMTYKYWLLLACFTWTINAQASDNSPNKAASHKEIINLAITKFEKTKKENWAYQVTRFENEEGDITSSIEKYNPAKAIENQWILVSSNGKVPSKKQANKFAKKKLEQRQKLNNKNKATDFSVPLREIVDLESLTFSTENASHIKMNFDVYLKKLGEDSKGKLKGSLSYNKQLSFIESITIVNNSALSPMFSANITDFKLTFTFT